MEQVLYISLPVGSNSAYTHCHCVSQAPIDRNHFFSNLFGLRDNLGFMNINEIRFIGGEPLIYGRLYDVLQILSCSGIKKTILTNGIGLFNELDKLERLVHRIDICRFRIDDWNNSGCFENINVPNIYDLEKISEKAKKNNINIRIVVPVVEGFKENIITFVDMVKYLEISSIVFRKIVKNINCCDFSFEEPILKYDIVATSDGKTSKTIIRNVKDIVVFSENICEETINKRIKNNEFLVYHPNGVLTNNWNCYANNKIKKAK